MLEIAELFYSLQGEGPFMGRPGVFVRLSRCVPPFCPFCDTTFAWEKGKEIPVETLARRILAHSSDFVVITGGEPFLQWASGLNRLEEALIQEGCFIQYETSGKVMIPSASKGFKVCSPKYLEGGWRFAGGNESVVDAFKFVVDDDFKIVDDFVDERKIPAEKVWIMPMGATRDAQLERFAPVWEYCAKRGFGFSPRLHTLAFDNKKGV